MWQELIMLMKVEEGKDRLILRRSTGGSCAKVGSGGGLKAKAAEAREERRGVKSPKILLV